MKTRRKFLGDLAALGAAGLSGCASMEAPPEPPVLPARDEFVFRNAYVITMDAAGDLADADVHVKGGTIAAVGRKLEADGAYVIDGRGMIVLPGLVETHWHMWNTLLRSMAGDERERGYFPTTLALGKVFLPSDMYQGTRLAAAEALNGGITFVHDWCHNIRSPQHAEEDLRALRESGIRARFSYGAAQGHPPDQTIDLADLERMWRSWAAYSNGGLLSLGLAWRGVSTGATGSVSAGAYKQDFDAARRLGIPISVHANNRKGSDTIAVLAREKFLGRDVQVIHATWVTSEEIRALADAGSSASFSPFTEMRIGFGFPPTGEFLGAHVPVGLSVDTVELSGNADMFAIMKVIQSAENARALSEFRLPARRVLQLGTIEGARSIGMDSRIGSLAPGKRADIIMVNTRDLNLVGRGDPAHLLVEAAQPANVDTVMVDGRILKRRGRLTAVDTARVSSEADAALVALLQRAGST
jgi:cytosine/adenosine deaminase-related metal-dependent hydrolase